MEYLKKLYRGWIKFGDILGKISSTIILTILYFIVLTPVALMYRLFSGAQLMKTEPLRKSYFIDRKHSFSKKDLENPW